MAKYIFFALVACTLFLQAAVIDVEYTDGAMIQLFDLKESNRSINQLIQAFENQNSSDVIDRIYLVTSDDEGTVDSMIIVARSKKRGYLSDDTQPSENFLESMDLLP